MITDDEDEAKEIAERLVEINKERREIQTLVEEALKQAESQKDDNAIIVGDEGWHPGVVGLVASRLKDV